MRWKSVPPSAAPSAPTKIEVPGRDAVVVLDHDEWTQQFAADPAIVDRRIHLGGVEFTVIGVAPQGFTGIDHDVKPAFYIPIAMYTAVQNGAAPDLLTDREARFLTVKGRLADGASMDQARQEVQQLATSLAQTYPDTNRNRDLFPSRPSSRPTAMTQVGATRTWS